MEEGKKKEKESAKKVAREFSTGGLVFKKENHQILWLVAKSASSKAFPNSSWCLPKDWLDDEGSGKSPGPLARGERKASEEELQKVAICEVKEEGGIEAKVVEKTGTERYLFTFENEKILKLVTFYLMEMVGHLREGFGFETE